MHRPVAARPAGAVGPVGPPAIRLLPVAAPIAGELGLGVAAGAAGLWLASRTGPDGAAAYLLGQHLLGALMLLLRVVGAGASVVVSQALGRGRRADADAVARATLAGATWAGLAAAAVAAVAGPLLLAAMQAPPEVRPDATRFLLLMAPVLVLDAWNQSYAAVLRSHLQGRVALRVTALMHGLHLAAAAALMTPGAGLGLDGFVLAMAASRIAGLVLHHRLWRDRLGLRARVVDALAWRHDRLAPVVRLGWPAAAEAGLYRLAFVVSVATAAHLGADAIALQGYVLQVNQVTLLPGLALGLACEIVCGHHLGAARLHAADRLVRRTLAVGLAASTAAAAGAALLAPVVLGAFTADASTLAAGAGLLALSVLLEPGRTFNLVLVNALRAAGDARFPVVAGAVSMTVVLAGGSWWLGVECGLGLAGVWIAYAADEWVRGLLMAWRWRRRAWVPHARRLRRAVARRRVAP